MLLILTNEIKGFEELLDTRERLIRREQYPGRLPHPCRVADRAPARCLWGHRFESCRDFKFLFLSRSWHTIITPLLADCIFLCKFKKWLNGNANTATPYCFELHFVVSREVLGTEWSEAWSFKGIVSLILGDPRAVSWVRKNGGESFQEQVREPLGYHS